MSCRRRRDNVAGAFDRNRDRRDRDRDRDRRDRDRDRDRDRRDRNDRIAGDFCRAVRRCLRD